MAPPRKRALPKPLPEGFILTDTDKKKWRLGKIIGQGGFGLIYLASRDVDRPVAADAEFVIKVEYQENGPLFSELKFYQRAAKPESVEKWKRSRKLDFLGIPTYWASGLAEYNDLRYRFMAMGRLGSDLQKVFDKNGGRLKKAAVLQLGLGLVTALEYIHENEYVHADIKAANLMLGYRDPEQVYLADYGLAYRYCPDGVHKEYKENPKKGHNGTIEYTSLDAHKGLAPSRRGDLQILGFCLLHWSCGSLPWDNALKNPAQVQEAKARLMDNLPDSVQRLSVGGASTDEVAAFLLYVKTLQYQEKPDYRRLEAALGGAITGRLDLSAPQRLKESASKPRGSSAGEKILQPMSQQTVRQARAVRRDVDDDDEEQEQEEGGMKCKLVPAGCVRGPPLTKPQVQQEARALPAGRSLRPRYEPVAYKEYDTEDEEDDDGEEEEAARPRPIPACYLRGPPIGPRTKQKETESKRTVGTANDLAMTTDRRLHGGELIERRNGGSILHRAGYSSRRWWDRDPRYDRSGEWAGSPGQAATPTQQTGPFPWLVLAAVLLLLSGVFGVCQSAVLSEAS